MVSETLALGYTAATTGGSAAVLGARALVPNAVNRAANEAKCALLPAESPARFSTLTAICEPLGVSIRSTMSTQGKDVFKFGRWLTHPRVGTLHSH